jgi:hypothetical protein
MTAVMYARPQREGGAPAMEHDKTLNKFILLNPKPAGEMVNPHVHRTPREREPDYDAMQRFIEKTAALTNKKSHD